VNDNYLLIIILFSYLCVQLQLVDLWYFMLIMLVFIVSYGSTSQVILYPNSTFDIVDIMKYAWWSIFGEFNIEEVYGQYNQANL